MVGIKPVFPYQVRRSESCDNQSGSYCFITATQVVKKSKIIPYKYMPAWQVLVLTLVSLYCNQNESHQLITNFPLEVSDEFRPPVAQFFYSQLASVTLDNAI